MYVTNPHLLLTQNLSDALTAMTSENRCGALSFSYYLCLAPTSFLSSTLGDLFSKAQADGQSVFVASGDHGADNCNLGFPNVSELAANPLVTAVGGTQVDSASYDQNGFSSGYSSESSLNIQNGDPKLAGQNSVSGGGISAIFKKPPWQVGVTGTSNDSFRDLPDVSSLAGSPGLIVYTDSHDAKGNASPKEVVGLYGGTSLAAPTWAGFSRLLQTANGGKRLGSLNPVIWALGIAGQAANGFHDITSGDNDFISDVNGKTVGVQGYSAGPGYDLVTGWGSIDASAFVSAYLNAPTPPPTVSSKLGATPANLKFATTAVGVASKARTVTLVNEARQGGPAITLNGFALTSNIQVSGGTCTVGERVAAKGKCTIAFVMTPATVGTNNGSVAIISNSSQGERTIQASVQGKMAKLAN